jgi:hypothetical protein
MNKIEWLYKAPEKTTTEEALRIVCRILRKNDAGHIAMALRHRKKWPNHPAGYCGLTKWIRKVLKGNRAVLDDMEREG